MNWQTFLDVMAWIWGVGFTFAVVTAVMPWFKYKDKVSNREWRLALFLASLCWAWIIAR